MVSTQGAQVEGAPMNGNKNGICLGIQTSTGRFVNSLPEKRSFNMVKEGEFSGMKKGHTKEKTAIRGRKILSTCKIKSRIQDGSTTEYDHQSALTVRHPQVRVQSAHLAVGRP